MVRKGSGVRVPKRAFDESPLFAGDVAFVSGRRGAAGRRRGNYLETFSYAEAWFCSLTGVGVPGRGFSVPQDVLDVRATPPNRTASTRRRETGPEGPSSAGEYPSGAALAARGLSRAAGAVAPLGRPDEALDSVLGQHARLVPCRGAHASWHAGRRCCASRACADLNRDDRIHGRAIVRGQTRWLLPCRRGDRQLPDGPRDRSRRKRSRHHRGRFTEPRRPVGRERRSARRVTDAPFPAGSRRLKLKGLAGQAATAKPDAGMSSHVRPSSSRPPAFGVRPPHCLKKKATPRSPHRSRRSRTHSIRIGL